MAMTACLAKLETSSTCVSERSNLLSEDANSANQFTLFEHGHGKEGSCATDVGQYPRGFSAAKISRFVSEVGYVKRLFCSRDTL